MTLFSKSNQTPAEFIYNRLIARIIKEVKNRGLNNDRFFQA
jgi:hypothetical protein